MTEILTVEELDGLFGNPSEPYKHTGTIADDYSLHNVMQVHGLLDLGRTVAPVLCDKDTWGKLVETRRKYWELKQNRESDCISPCEEYRAMNVVLEGYNEFFEKLYTAIGTRCKEKEAERKQHEKEMEKILDRIEQADGEGIVDGIRVFLNEMMGVSADTPS